VSRGGGKRPERVVKSGTPIWVWFVYTLGIVAGIVISFSLLFTTGALFLSNDVAVSYRFSTPAAIVWSAIALLALVTWIARRRQRT
jgi:membrane-associated PAP2 superfamily phosphatase